MKGFVLLLVVFCCVAVSASFVHAQNGFLQWHNAPSTGFVYRISNDEAKQLLTQTQPDTAIATLLHTAVDTFTVSKGWTHRPAQGHFILVRVDQNKLHCEYVGILPYQVLLLNTYNALSLQVLDLDGNVRADARVRFKTRRIRFDKSSHTYRIDNAGFNASSKYVTVELDGFRSVFHLTKHGVPAWSQDYYDYDDGPDFYSYMITDKNKYKPGERVRFKSYALSGSRVPVRRDLQVRLVKPGYKIVPLGSVSPHRPGSFAGEFQLHDSLHLTLDKHYTVQLLDKKGRVVANCSFRYEDYELQGTKLHVSMDTSSQFHPASNHVKITATTENGLPLKDGRATVVVFNNNIRETFEPLVILPDTLLHQDIKLDDNGPTLLEIPSSLFQKSNTTYRVLVTVWNSQNQRLEATTGAAHYYSQYALTASYVQDSIVYQLLCNGTPLRNVPVKIYRDDATMTSFVTTLPYREKINPAAVVVRLESPLASRTFRLADMLPKLGFTGGIQQDSFNLSLTNPQKTHVSWYIYRGGELLEKGAGTDLAFRSKIEDRTQTYYAELLYAFGGEERLISKAFTFRESSLDIAFDIPDRVYPGQQVEATLSVTINDGIPVAGVDLTALATTAKLDYTLPDLPYYGDESYERPRQASYSKHAVNKRIAVIDLKYALWKPRLHLDTMRYYQFTYPYDPFFYQQDITDSTQFAVYVMKNGMAKQVYVIEVDRIPVYYSWTNHPRGYSFYIEPEKHKQVTLRLHDRVLILDSLCFDAGKKTIISVDLDHLPDWVKVVAVAPRTKMLHKRRYTNWEFTDTEVNRHTTYMAVFTGTFQPSYLETGRLFVPLSRGGNAGLLQVVGPVAPGMQTYGERNRVETRYRHAGGFSYVFEDNIVYKMPLPEIFPERLTDVSYNPTATLNDRVVNKQMLLSAETLPRARWHPQSIDLVDNLCRVKLVLPYEDAQSGVASVLLQDVKNCTVMSPCRSYNEGTGNYEYFTIPRGLYHAIVVYQNGTYLKMDSVALRSYRQVVIDMNNRAIYQADVESRNWSRYATGDCIGSLSPYQSRIRTYRKIRTGNVHGRVIDGEKMAIPGVNVIIKGTDTGAVTDIDGNFALDIYDDRVTLVMSFIGYKTLEAEVTQGSEIAVILEPDVTALQEVVVVAYGTQSKKDMLGSVSSVLAGRVAGVSVSRNLTDATEDGPETLQDDGLRDHGAQQLYRELLTLKNIRSAFSDVGFWEPRLYTDGRGQAKFTIRFPDDITQWHAVVYAMNRQLKTGTLRKRIQSYKPIMAELHVPQFLTMGDSACLLGKVLNYTTDKTLHGKTRWYGAATSENSVHVDGYHVEKQCVVPATADSLSLRYDFTRDDGYYDGEARRVPVVSQGTVRANGTLQILANGNVLTVKPEPGGTTRVALFDTPLTVYANDVRDLIDYKYACNEQLASKLMGLLNYRLIRQYQGNPFEYDNDVNKIIQRLLKNQNAEFLWSWWDVSPNTSHWMSSHILRALHAAKVAGYTVNLDVNNLARKATYQYDYLQKIALSDVYVLHALAIWDAPMDYAHYLRMLDNMVQEADLSARTRATRYTHRRFSLLNEKLMLLEVRQLQDLPLVRDSLLRYKKETLRNAVYFADDLPSAHWHADGVSANAIAYRIIRRDSTLKDLCVPMQAYFLLQRRRSSWNTYEAANVLSGILPDLIAQGATQKAPGTVILTGAVNAPVTQFPYRLTLTDGQSLQVRKDSGLPMYLMQYTEERVTTAHAGTDGFTIKTTFSEKALTAGKPVTLETTIDIKDDAGTEHVMIEVPIPGSCSYADKNQRHNGVETHREYFKEKTVIFCERMTPGRYVFSIPLLPRFSGTYHVNPAQVSLMYFPVVNANNAMKQVKIME